MKIALAQTNPVVGDLSGNFEKIENFCLKAAKAGCQFVATPELSLLGYPPRDLLAFRELKNTQAHFIEKIKKLSNDLKLGISVGFAEGKKGPGKPFYNSVLVFDSGKELGVIRKKRNPSYDIFEEDRFFDPNPTEGYTSAIKFRDKILHFFICEDLWSSIAAHGIRDIRNYSKTSSPLATVSEKFSPNSIGIFVSASPYWVGKQQARLDLVTALTRRHQLPICFVNQVGANDDLVFDGGSFAIDAQGNLVEPPLFFKSENIYFDLNKPSPSLGDFQVENYWEGLENGIRLGIQDYFLKNKFKKGVLGISGGIDSALVACIAAKAIGPENLELVYLPSSNNQNESLEISKTISRNLKCGFRVIEIDDWIADFKKKLSISSSGIAYENLQSRLRGLSLMEISNLENRLLLATGNKSELAVGYSTLYGDMCGILLPIGDLYKTEVYGLSFYLNQKAKQVGNPAPIPNECLLRLPSAELSQGQNDQQSLPPYEILDGFLFELIENQGDFRGGLEAWDEILQEFGYQRDQLYKKFFGAEFKRKQAAPVLKLHQRSFGLGWRLPLTHQFKL